MCFEKPFSVCKIQFFNFLQKVKKLYFTYSFLTFCKKGNQDLHFAGKSANICLALKAREC